MSHEPKFDELLEPVKTGRWAAVRRILLGAMICAVPVVAAPSQHSLGGADTLYAVLDVGTAGSLTHKVVSVDIGDPNNISFVPFGTIAGFADKYFVSAAVDPVLNKLFFVLSDSTANTSADYIYLYGVTFPDLLTVTPFAASNQVYVNLNPQATYNTANNLFYYAINNAPLGFDYGVNTLDSGGSIVASSINDSNIQNSSSGLNIFNSHIYAIYRPGNSFTAYYAGLTDNSTGSTSSPITPQPPGQIWSTFDSAGVLWGTTQVDASSPPGLSLYRLQCTTAGLPASTPFASALIGLMPTMFEGSAILNATLFASALPTPVELLRFVVE